jgi:DNA topoisomerase I
MSTNNITVGMQGSPFVSGEIDHNKKCAPFLREQIREYGEPVQESQVSKAKGLHHTTKEILESAFGICPECSHAMVYDRPNGKMYCKDCGYVSYVNKSDESVNLDSHLSYRGIEGGGKIPHKHRFSFQPGKFSPEVERSRVAVKVLVKSAFVKMRDKAVRVTRDQLHSRYVTKMLKGDFAKLDPYTEGLIRALMAALQPYLEELSDDIKDPLNDAAQAGVSGAAVDIQVDDKGMINGANIAARNYADQRAAELVGMRYKNGVLIPNPNAKWAITDTTRDTLNDIFTRAFEQETPMNDIIEQVQNAGIFSDARAEMIARTEIARAQTQGVFGMWRQTGMVESYDWLISDNANVCDECEMLAYSGPYQLMDGPLPPDDSHPNCQCIIAANMIDASRGLLPDSERVPYVVETADSSTAAEIVPAKVTKIEKPKCPHCGSREYSLMPTDFETAKCHECGKNWNHGIVPGINDPSDVEKIHHPHKIRHGDKWNVVDDDGKVYGTHDSEDKADAQLSALYANKVEKGGSGSGDFGHEGRPGEVGGSSESGEASGGAPKPEEPKRSDGWDNGIRVNISTSKEGHETGEIVATNQSITNRGFKLISQEGNKYAYERRQGNVISHVHVTAGKNGQVNSWSVSTGSWEHIGEPGSHDMEFKETATESGKGKTGLDTWLKTARKVVKVADGGWIGVDMDGTLAMWEEGQDLMVIGPPTPPDPISGLSMVDRVKEWLSEGKDVRIFTARVADDTDGTQRRLIEEWCKEYIGQALHVTNEKDHHMTDLWDDRAHGVERNTGIIKHLESVLQETLDELRKGDIGGHEFHGNQYTDGVGLGEGTSLFHGTTADKAEQILQSSFKASVGGMYGNGVYATDDLSKAQSFGGDVLRIKLNPDVNIIHMSEQEFSDFEADRAVADRWKEMRNDNPDVGKDDAINKVLEERGYQVHAIHRTQSVYYVIHDPKYIASSELWIQEPHYWGKKRASLYLYLIEIPKKGLQERIIKGGEGSGNYGHEGRIGEVGGSGSGHSVSDVSTIPLFRSSDHTDLHISQSGYSALGAGVYFGLSEKEINGYGGEIKEYFANGKLLNVQGDKEFDIYRQEAKQWAQDKLQHVDWSKPTVDDIKLSDPSTALSMYFQSKGYVGVYYHQSDPVNDHHSQVVIYDVSNIHVKKIVKSQERVAKGGEGSGNFGHEGRPGEVGGSAEGSFGGASYSKETGWTENEWGGKLPDHIASLRIPPAWNNVQFAKDPEAKLLVTGEDSKGRQQSIYSAAFIQQQADAKWARIDEMDKKYEEIHASVNSDIVDGKNVEEASALRLIMSNGVRPGDDRDTGGKVQAYGATTLEGRHVVGDNPDNVRLQFVGKKGVDHDLHVTDREVATDLLRRRDAAGPNGKVYDTSQDKLLVYTHSKDGGGFKTKDFRTLLATKTAQNEVASMKLPRNMKEYKASVKTVAEKVSSKLGNTPSVALNSYISPTVFGKWHMSATHGK